MANLKKFLIPVTAAIAGLTTVNSQATVDLKAPVTELKSDQIASKLSAISREETKRVIFAEGDELHSLLLGRNAQGMILSQHESHYSHRSHESHSSHRSHYSGY
jgi:hypothetical protein